MLLFSDTFTPESLLRSGMENLDRCSWRLVAPSRELPVRTGDQTSDFIVTIGRYISITKSNIKKFIYLIAKVKFIYYIVSLHTESQRSSIYFCHFDEIILF